MGGYDHIIHRQTYRLTTRSRSSAAGLQAQVSKLHRNTLSVIMGEALDEAISKNEFLLIDRLEIDLGVIPPGNWQKEISFRLKKLLREKIVETSLVSENVQGSGYTAKKHLAIHFSDEVERKRELLFYFLQRGRLPWWWPSDEEIKIESLWEIILDDNSAANKKRFEELLVDRKVGKRIIEHIPGERLKGFVLFVFAEEKTSREVFRFVEILLTSLTRFERPKGQKIISAFYKQVILNAFEIDGHKFKHGSLPIARLYRLVVKVLHQFKVRVTEKQLQEFQEADEQTLKEAPPQIQEMLQRMAESLKDPTVQNKSLRPDLGEPTKRKPGPPFFTEEEEEAMVVANAGMVLLYPYLKLFFGQQDLLNEGNRFIDAKSQAKAMHLLHYLCTGQKAEAEFELTLNKVLCGWPIEEPVSMDFKITKKTKKDALDLLQSAIKNWSALKSTSPDGLRQAFLEREGLLYYNEERVLVRIERRTHDILLDRLPYTLSMFRLPWLETMIYIEW